jgi:hypothetical protein
MAAFDPEASMEDADYRYGLSVRDLFVGDEVRLFKNGANADDIAQVSALHSYKGNPP